MAFVVCALVACIASFSAAAPAQGPTFDGTEAKGEVEQRICSAPSLAALDRKLDQVDKAVSANAKGKIATQLRQQVAAPQWLRYPAISPDGRAIAFAADGQLWLIDALGGEAIPLISSDFYSTAAHPGP
jgi:hypothetical protein